MEEFLPWENVVCTPLLVQTVFLLVSEREQIHRNLLQNNPQKALFTKECVSQQIQESA